MTTFSKWSAAGAIAGLSLLIGTPALAQPAAPEAVWARGLDAAITPQARGHEGSTPRVAEGELLLSLREGVGPDRLGPLLSRVGGRVLAVGAHSGLIRIGLPLGADLQAAARALRRSDDVRAAYPNAIIEGSSCPGGDYDDLTWYRDAVNLDAICHALNSDILSTVTVAVLDTGVAYLNKNIDGQMYRAHPDLGKSDFVPGYDFVNDDAFPVDDHQHGTHMAGIIAAQGQVVGVAPGATIMPVKVLDSQKIGTEFSLVEGIYFAVENGADILNMSLSFGLGYFPSAALQDAIAFAATHEVIMVSSAGDNGALGIAFPAAFPEVIGVAAAQMLAIGKDELNAERASYSNQGMALDVTAPGGSIDADVDGDGHPDGVLAPSFDLNHPDLLGHWFVAGTSQAAAQVSGLAAWLVASGASPATIQADLMASSQDLGYTGFDPSFGAGMISPGLALDQTTELGSHELPATYVSILPWLHVEPDGSHRARFRLQVLDEGLDPIAGAEVGVAFFGTYTRGGAREVTDTNGFVTYETAAGWSHEAPLAIGIQVTAVAFPESQLPSRPLGFYSLTPAMAEAYSIINGNPQLSESALIFEQTPDNAALNAQVGDADRAQAYVMRPLAAGFRSGPMAVLFNDAFAPEVTGAVGTQLGLDWPQKLASGSGEWNQLPARLVEATAPQLGHASQFLFLPFDPAMEHLDLTLAYPVVNAMPEAFDAINILVGNTLKDTTFAGGFAASSMGTGFASSSLGDAFAASSLGDAFAASSMGNAFAASSLGDAFAASSLGNGFASSSLGNGFAASSLGDAFAASSMGSSDAATGLVSGASAEPPPCDGNALCGAGSERLASP